MSRGLDEGLRKGWCPGALRPMAAADGLIVRLRLDLRHPADRNGAGDCRPRRGARQRPLRSHRPRQPADARREGTDTLPALLDALRALGLVDADAAAESVRNVIASPLAGLHDGPDIRPLVAALEARLAGTPALHALPGRSSASWSTTAAHRRSPKSPPTCVSTGRGEEFVIGLGGTRDECALCERARAGATEDWSIARSDRARRASAVRRQPRSDGACAI